MKRAVALAECSFLVFIFALVPAVLIVPRRIALARRPVEVTTLYTEVFSVPELIPAGLENPPRSARVQGWSFQPPPPEPLAPRAQVLVDEIKTLSHWAEVRSPGSVMDVDLERRAILVRSSKEHIAEVWAAVEQLRDCARQRGR